MPVTQPIPAPVFNVKNYGALGDGSTDDTTAISNAIAGANAAGGGQVFFPQGTYITGKQTIYAHVAYVGSGFGESILKLKNASTTNLLEGDQFSTLTGGTTDGGPYHWQIRDLQLDGNKANCPSGLRGVAVYGYEFTIENLLIRNCQTDGLFVEYGGPSSSIGADALLDESFTENVKVFDCNGIGVWAAGVHDSYFGFIMSARNPGGNFRLDGKSNNWVACHGWGGSPNYCWYLKGQENLVACQAEGAAVAQIFVEWHEAHLVAPRIFNPVGSTAAGIVLGDGSHTPNKVVIEGARFYPGLAASFPFAPAIDFTHAGSQLVVHGSVDQASGTVYSGAIPTDADVDLIIGGGAAQASVYQKPSTGVPKIVRRSSDTAARNNGNTGSTLTNDDTLLFAVGANDIWLIEAILLISAANTVMDFKAAWSVPASGVLKHGVTGNPSSNQTGWGSTLPGNTAIVLADATTAVPIGTPASSAVFGAGFQGIYTGGGTAGTVIFQWAQNTADAGNLILKANSLLRLTRLA